MVLHTGSYARHESGSQDADGRQRDSQPNQSGYESFVAFDSWVHGTQPQAKAQTFHSGSYHYDSGSSPDAIKITLNQPEDLLAAYGHVGRLGRDFGQLPQEKAQTFHTGVYYARGDETTGSGLGINEIWGIDVAGIQSTDYGQDIGGRSGSVFGARQLVAYHVLEDNAPPFVQNRSPSSGTIEVPRSVVLQFQINDLGEGFGSGVDINTIHVKIAEVGQPFDDVIISGAFQAPFTGISSSIVPAGYFVSGTYRGFDVQADNTLLYVQEADYLLSITASDIYGNIGFDEYPFKMEGGCPPFLAPILNDGDYTIINGAMSMLDHETRAGCQVQQAPRQFGIRGVLSLRNQGRAAYTNVPFNRTYTQRNKTEHPLGLATTPETAITNHQLSVTVQNFVDEFYIIPRADGDALKITGNGVFTFPEVFQKGDAFNIQPVSRPDLSSISITGGVGVFNQVSETGTLINGFTDIRSMQFDGNHYLTIPSSSVFDFNNGPSGSAFTILAWVYFDSTGSEQGLVSRWNTKTGDAQFMFGLGAGGVGDEYDGLMLRVPTASVQQDGDVEPYERDVSSGIIPGAWQQIAAVYSGSAALLNDKIKLYRNTLEIGTRVGPVPTSLLNSNEPIHIGLIYDVTSSVFQGKISELAFYNVPLTSQEIAEIYNTSSVSNKLDLPTAPNLVAWYRMGDHINDSSGSVIDVINGNNAVITRATGSGPFYINDHPGNV